MTQPTSYAPATVFATYQRNNPAAPFNGALLDVELDAIETSLDETIANLALLQRDDGGLRNSIVTPDSLDAATLNLIGSWNPIGPWLPAQVYARLDMVTVGVTTSYVCAVAHTSSSFAIDLAAGYWQQVNGGGDSFINVQFSTNDVILGRVSAGSGSGEEIACTSFARTLLDDSDAATARTTLGIGNTSDPVFSDVTVDSLTVSGLTASTMIYANAAKALASTAAPTNGQLLIGSTGANPVLASITGTANQVNVTPGAGSITLSLPQNINSGATPTFVGLNLGGLSQGSVVFIGSSSALSQNTSAFIWDNTNIRLGIGTPTPTANLHVARTGGGAVALGNFFQGDANTVGYVNVVVDGAGTGDPQTTYSINAVQEWSVGIDNSDSDSFKISANFDLATATMVSIKPSGLVQFLQGSGIAILGSATADLQFGNGTTVDTHLKRDNAADSLAMVNSTTAQVFRVYRTFTDTSNYERAALQSGAGYFELAAETAGTGTDDISLRLTPSGIGNVRVANNLLLASSAARIQGDFSNATRASRTLFQDQTTNNSTNVGAIANGTGVIGAFTAFGGSSDPDNAHALVLSGGATSVTINSVQFGTGTQRALELQLGSTTRFLINTSGVCNVASSTATPAAGSSTACLLFGTTAGFGIYYGSGAPTVSAAQGSIYLRSDGSGVANRLYVNTDGATTWTNFVTAA